jgi:hypothetical protein
MILSGYGSARRGLASAWTRECRALHPHVRFGSEADNRAAKSHVRFTPESGHVRRG